MANFLSLIPPGWLREYLEAMEEAQNEMPLAFHFLAGAAVIGQMIGLQAWGTLAKGVRVFPNVNALLLSPAGLCRRGEGTKITMAVARKAGVNVFAGKSTPEGLIDELIDNGNLLLYVEELSMLLTQQDFQRPIIPVLTKLLLHGEGIAEFRARYFGQKRNIPFVNLSAIFTSAPDWFIQTIPQEAYGGGLMSRFVVCCLDERDVYHVDIQAEDQKDETVESLAANLRQIRGVLQGHIRGTDAAQKWMEEWYHENERKMVEDPRHAPHRNRKPANLLRLALVLCASGGSAVLDRDRLEQSLKILNWYEPTMMKLYKVTDESASMLMRGEKRLLTKMASQPDATMTHIDLSRACASYFKRGVREMRECLESLQEKGIVEALHRSEHIKKWPPKGWRLKKEVRVE